MNKQVVVVTVAGDISSQELPKETLSGLYAMIGCRYVDVVGLEPDLDMWVDEDGIATDEMNYLASMFTLRYGSRQLYFGTAVFASRTPQGETAGLSEQKLEEVLRSLRTLKQMEIEEI